jgi:hypothetical protein
MSESHPDGLGPLPQVGAGPDQESEDVNKEGFAENELLYEVSNTDATMLLILPTMEGPEQHSQQQLPLSSGCNAAQLWCVLL